MNEQWRNAVVTGIEFAIYVGHGDGKVTHTDRPYHGLVLNDDCETGKRSYFFSDGRVLKTEGRALFYLPKGSTYTVRTSGSVGGCYAINFYASLADEPFCVYLRNFAEIRKTFSEAALQWKKNAPSKNVTAMCAVYEAISMLLREEERQYQPAERYALLVPALSRMEDDFTDRELSVSSLASLCGVSEVYFRRLFQNHFGVSPKEYLIEKRLHYAAQLLATHQFSIGDVAQMCGYSEVCHFSREFSKRMGVPPSEYEKG